MDYETKEFIKLFTGLLSLIFIVSFGIISLIKWQERIRCDGFERESGFETKFVKYNGVNFDCLVKQNDGWISAENLIGIKK